jgi:hypothetical protein
VAVFFWASKKRTTVQVGGRRGARCDSAVRAEKLARKAACHVCKTKEEDGAEFS